VFIHRSYIRYYKIIANQGSIFCFIFEEFNIRYINLKYYLIAVFLTSFNIFGNYAVYNYEAESILYDVYCKTERKKFIYRYFGLYDGHGTEYVSNYLLHNLYLNFRTAQFSLKDKKEKYSLAASLTNSFKEMQEGLDSDLGMNQGATALVIYIYKDHLYVANCGDSRAIICANGKPYNLHSEHKSDLIDNKYLFSRAIGYKSTNLISAVPEIKKYDLLDSYEFIIMATSVFWNFLTTEAAIELARHYLSCGNAVDDVVEELGRYAINRGAENNLSLILIKLK
jgi:protein phosphatase 1B